MKKKIDVLQTNLDDLKKLLAVPEFGIGNSPETRQVMRMFVILIEEIQKIKKDLYGKPTKNHT